MKKAFFLTCLLFGCTTWYLLGTIENYKQEKKILLEQLTDKKRERITHERLLEFGFEYHGPDYVLLIGRHYYSLETFADTWAWYHNGDDMLYLYQLQEAYRRLTGRELKRKY